MGTGGGKGAKPPRSEDKEQRLKRATTQSLLGRDNGRADARLRDFSKTQQ